MVLFWLHSLVTVIIVTNRPLHPPSPLSAFCRYLSGNQISGSLPPAIGDLHDLEHLWIEDNKLTGPLPAEIGNCTSLQILYLSNNNISGSLPDSIGQLRAMRDMRLDQNMLSGALPPSIGALSNLTVLGGSGGLSTVAIIAVVCGSLFLVTAVLVAFLVWCCCRPGSNPFKHVKVVDQEEFDDAGLIPSLCCRYSLVEIRRATNNWSEQNRIGSGQHSDVYKGTCPYNPASTWAVKRYKERSSHFDKEVEQIASKWHPNLAHLLGYCVDSDTRVEGGRMVQVEEKIAVYEYVHHGDLSRFGVIFLELLTGRPPFIQVQAEHGEDHVHIADWAAPLIDEGKTEELKDPHLDVPESSFLSLAELAIRCTAMPFTDRPPMGEVLATLKAIRTDFFGLTDPDDVYGGEGSGGLENGFGGDDGDVDGRPDWGVSINNV
ncbi:unnamed protein product [Closterium sp. Yama58-4]|nr:unnamed protein product [Closterium sp. Yama58-4]